MHIPWSSMPWGNEGGGGVYPVENSCLAYQYNTTFPKLPGHVAQLASSTADPWVAS